MLLTERVQTSPPPRPTFSVRDQSELAEQQQIDNSFPQGCAVAVGPLRR